MRISDELKKQAMKAKSAEELLRMARNNHMNITPEEAEHCYSSLHAEDKLSDDELNNVAGGGWCDEEAEYCPACGARLEDCGDGTMECPNCGAEVFFPTGGNPTIVK